MIRGALTLEEIQNILRSSILDYHEGIDPEEDDDEAIYEEAIVAAYYDSFPDEANEANEALPWHQSRIQQILDYGREHGYNDPQKWEEVRLEAGRKELELRQRDD